MITSDDSPPSAAALSAQTPDAASMTTHRFQFRGSTAEFFKIWIVNIALSFLTLGFYAPWAKVRTKRYFYANTYLDGANFDYHAKPVSILIARIIVLLILVGGSLLLSPELYGDENGLYYLLLLFLFLPWAWVRGLSFNARNSSYRNVRFSFRRGYGFPYLFYALFLTGIGIFIMPWLLRGYHQFKIERHQLGKTPFSFATPSIWRYIGGLTYILLPILTLLVIVYYAFFYHILDSSIGSNPFVDALIFLFIAILSIAQMQAVFFRLFWDNIRTENGAAFHCNFSTGAFIKILLVNYSAIILSLGLLTPWAKVRKTKFLTDNITLTAPAGLLDSIIARRGEKESPFGEEFDTAEGFDFDVGII